jgi:hypothetical protein
LGQCCRRVLKERAPFNSAPKDRETPGFRKMVETLLVPAARDSTPKPEGAVLCAMVMRHSKSI